MTIISLEQAQAKLSELIANLAPGDEVVITKDNQPVAQLVGCAEAKKRQLGTMKGTVAYMASDFDAPLDEFKEYMESPKVKT
ncbi:MAG: type II toxin-antitoxin system prevent-host-death family antitoxin [Planctomycetota bacterium]